MKYWHEVPKENHEELKQKLFQAIVMFGNGPRIVLNRLCIAVSKGICFLLSCTEEDVYEIIVVLFKQLSAFIVHMIAEHPTAIEDIVTTFQNQQMPNVSSGTQLWILMEVLGGIPEEVTLRKHFTKTVNVSTILRFID